MIKYKARMARTNMRNVLQRLEDQWHLSMLDKMYPNGIDAEELMPYSLEELRADMMQFLKYT